MTGPVVLTVLVRDEVDILADMLRYHLGQGVDHVIAMDNGSTDGTTEILRDFEAMGCLTRIAQPSESYLQDVWTTEMAHLARDRFGAAWVIPSDADEFWMPDDPATSLRDVLDAVPDDASLVTCPRHNLSAPWNEIEALGWRAALVWRAERPATITPARLRAAAPLEAPFAQGYMAPKAILRPRRVTRIGRGAHPHDVDIDGDGPAPAAPITIHHAPFRSCAEVAASIARIGTAIATDPSAGPDVSAKYRRWHAMAETAGIDDVMAEIMPAPETIARDRMTGRIRVDSRLSDIVRPREAGHAARLALSGAGAGPDRTWLDPAGPPVPVLLAGGAEGRRAKVARRLHDLGVRALDMPYEDPFDWQTRIAAILRAMGPEPADALLAEFQASQRMHEGNWHGLVLDAPDVTTALPVWKALRASGDLAPALILLSDAEGSGAATALEAQSRDMPRLIARSDEIVRAPAAWLHEAMACLGLWVPISVALAAPPGTADEVTADPALLRAAWGI